MYAMVGTVNQTQVAEKNVSDTLIGAIQVFGGTVLANRIETYYVTGSRQVVSPLSTYDLEIIMRGNNVSLVPFWKQNLDDARSAYNGTWQFYGGLYSLTEPTVVNCSNLPPESLVVTRQWSGVSLPGVKATYVCDRTQYVSPHGKGISTCSHDTLKWNDLEAGITCKEGCEADPPSRPLNANWTWDSKTYDVNTRVDYTCLPGYRSGDGSNAFSICDLSGKWTVLPPTYFCTELPCLDPIPQVPSQAISDFKEERRIAGSVITYTCIPGFIGTGKSDMTVTCSKGNWTQPTIKNWNCTNVNAINLAEMIQGEMDIPDQLLTPDERQRKYAMNNRISYFWYCTLPAMAGMVAVMVVCLCCTRTDSPLYNFCGGYKPDAFNYQHFKKNFRKQGNGF
ncbi:uncharacterized protein LOC108672406 [Hyalella azteca]|uniref:Uncharacterized protein LOC108672406 n=1 Tax=Hyalella azteca TaxID=294128 RepID=A0A8B7NR39_HYAAZ|nr:uncharacterized protein LOC108672406 [Hyalella azteca]